MIAARTIGVAVALAMAVTSVSAQESFPRYTGWRGSDMIEARVETPSGAWLGNVEDLILNPDGAVDRIVVETPGFLDMGDREFAVPWSVVLIAPGLERIVVPGPGVADTPAGPGAGEDENAFRDLLDWPVVLRDGTGFGRLDDVIFGP
ncbi:MAG TPA: PRC-barrel domain-containing protein, partial [Alphaproteobacteria bacterium]|nr:PRC-barrel domain-containing protein [Alphaproteobacteria bacterium]